MKNRFATRRYILNWLSRMMVFCYDAVFNGINLIVNFCNQCIENGIRKNKGLGNEGRE